jgi:hypothetical protein
MRERREKYCLVDSKVGISVQAELILWKAERQETTAYLKIERKKKPTFHVEILRDCTHNPNFKRKSVTMNRRYRNV